MGAMVELLRLVESVVPVVLRALEVRAMLEDLSDQMVQQRALVEVSLKTIHMQLEL
jgi:hypothetical protein